MAACCQLAAPHVCAVDWPHPDPGAVSDADNVLRCNGSVGYARAVADNELMCDLSCRIIGTTGRMLSPASFWA